MLLIFRRYLILEYNAKYKIKETKYTQIYVVSFGGNLGMCLSFLLSKINE